MKDKTNKIAVKISETKKHIKPYAANIKQFKANR